MAMSALRRSLIIGFPLSLLQQELLHPPIRSLRHVELPLRRTRERVRAGELPEISPRPADDAEHRAVERYLEDASRIRRLADEQHLRRAWRDAYRVRRTDHAPERLAGRCRAVHGTRR